MRNTGSIPAASTKRGTGSLKRLPFLRFMEVARSWISAGTARVAEAKRRSVERQRRLKLPPPPPNLDNRPNFQRFKGGDSKIVSTDFLELLHRVLQYESDSTPHQSQWHVPFLAIGSQVITLTHPKREIVLTLKTKIFSEACMAALEISKELSGLFKKLEQGIGLLNPDDRSIFAATTVNNATDLLKYTRFIITLTRLFQRLPSISALL